MGKLLVNKIREINPQAKKGMLLLLALLVSFACMTVPRNADAAVVAQMNWKNTAGTANTGTLTSTSATAGTYYRGTTALPGANNAYTLYGSGTNRLLVVALIANTSVPSAALRPAVTYGGQSLTKVISANDEGISSRQHTWLFTLNEAGLQAASGNNLAFTYGGTDAGLVFTGTFANAALYNGADQGAPATPANYNTGAATKTSPIGPLVPSQTVAIGDSIVEVVDLFRTGSTTARTLAAQTGFTRSAYTTQTGATPANYAMRTAIMYRHNSTTAATYTSAHTTNGAALVSMSGMTIKQAVIPSVANGAAVPNLNVYASDSDKAVDAFTFTGGGSVTGVTITGSASVVPANVTKAHVYRKVGADNTKYEAGDVEIGLVNTPTSPFPITFTVAEPVVLTNNYIITYDIAAGAQAVGTATTLTGRVTALAPSGGTLNDTNGAILTVLPTTSINDAAEPPPARVKNASALTLLDAFSVRHTGVSPGDDDIVTEVTVTMSPATISGGTAATLSKIKRVEIISCTDGFACAQGNTTVYGAMTAATIGDTWNIPLNLVPNPDPQKPAGFIITSAPVTYFVRISTADTIIPSNNDPSCIGSPTACTGYYGVRGTITGFLHTLATNKPVFADSNSQTVAIDFETPNDVTAFTAQYPDATDPDGSLDLTWVQATDRNGGFLDPVKPYKIVRGAANGGVPNPFCIDGTDISLAGATINYLGGTARDVGLASNQATQYKYRLCTIDSLGNISRGVTSYNIAKVQSVCTNPPILKLSPASQIIKSAGVVYALSVSNMDTGVCANYDLTLSIVNETGSNPAHFTKTFAPTVTVGTGGGSPHANTGANALITIGANASAVQLENYSFSVQVTTPGHGSTQTLGPVTGLLNDMPPIVHNSANMNKFSYGGWGQTYTCSTCHSNSTTNIKGVYTLISTPIGRRSVTFTKTSSVSTDYIGVMGNDQRTVKNTSTYVCSVCHHKTRQQQYSANKTLAGPNNDQAYVSDHNNSRDCAKCHTHNTAFRSITGVCGECHGDASTGYAPVDSATMVKDTTNALGAATFSYGAHARHNAVKVGCGACHSNTNHGLDDTAWQGNGKLDMGFSIGSATFTGFNPTQTITGGDFYGTSNLNYPYSWVPGAGTTITPLNDYNNSCVTYCHGNWNGNAGNGSQQQPIWIGGGNEVICGSCHYATGATPPESGSHLKHAASTGAGLNIACYKCHAANQYVNFTGAAHINGRVQWNLSSLPPLGRAKYGPAGSETVRGATANVAGANTPGRCDNLYCHSTVQTGNGTGAPVYKQPTWGGTVTCGDCHAEPNMSGSHQQHEGVNSDGIAFDCHVCHYNGGTTTPTNHANGYINFQFNGLAAGTTYSLGTAVPAGTQFGSCNSRCHGRDARTWGTGSTGVTLCEKCHGSATSAGGFYGTKGPGSSVFNNESGVGVHDIHIQNPNSPRKATFASFTSFAKAFSCKQCHYVPKDPFTAGHIDTALPAEAGFSHQSSIAKNGRTFGYYSVATFNPVTKSCNSVWCHGAGMSSNRGIDVYVAGNLVSHYAGTTPSGRAIPKWNTPQLTGNRATDCTMCHALPPPAPNATYTHFGKTLAQCNECHKHLASTGLSFDDKSKHVNGVIDGGCGGCHGNPPITADISSPTNPNNTGLATPAVNAIPLGQAGAHNVHTQLPAIGLNCNTCHNGASQSMPSNELEIGFAGLGGQVNTGSFSGYSGALGNPHWKSSSAGTQRNVQSVTQDLTCSAVYCHGGGSTSSSPVRPVIGGGNGGVTPFYATPSWTGGVACGDCHGVDNVNHPDGGSHQRHSETVAALGCTSCHGDTPDNGTHVNGQVSWKLDRSNPAIRSLATYNNTSSGFIVGLAPRGLVTVGDDYRHCDNVYCHSNVQGASGNGLGNPTSYGSPRWGTDNGTLGCNGCHNNYATYASATPGSHLKHANTGTGNLGLTCGTCHHDGGDGSTQHADNFVYVNFSTGIGGKYATYSTLPGKKAGSAAYTTCSNTSCHGATSPAWGAVGPLLCNSCHSAKADDAFFAANSRHNTHYAANFLPTSFSNSSGSMNLSSSGTYRFACGACHDPRKAKHSKGAYSANAAAEVFFGFSGNRRGTYTYAGAAQGTTDNGLKWTASNGPSCATTYCHSDGKGGNPKVTSFTWAQAATNSCTFCHDTKTTGTATTLSGKHDKHMNSSNNTIMGLGNGFNCVDCHAQTIQNTNNTTLFDKSKHIDKIANYSGARANKGLNSVTKECSNIYCHSNGNPNAIVFVSMTGSKNWNGATFSITTCNMCHGRSNALGYPDYANGWPATQAKANLHPGHLAGMADTTACADCHRKTADPTTANKFRPYSTMHLSGGPDLSFNKTKSYIGTKGTVATVGMQVTCSQIVCHGQGAPVWGAATTANTCQKCHGSKVQAFSTFSSPQVAPGYNNEGTDTSMVNFAPTSPRVGAHQRHMVSNAIADVVKCGSCHVPVTNIRSGNHWNYSTATITFTGSRTTGTDLSHLGSNARVGGITQCSNLWCHGSKSNSGTTVSPFWNMTGMVSEAATTVGACVKCHAMPPPAVPNHSGTTTVNTDAISTLVTKCQGCHNNVSSSATRVDNAFSNKSLHVNGIIEVVANCDSCHDYDTNGGTWGSVKNQNYGGTAGIEGRGAHYKHIEYLKAKNPGLSLVPNGDTWASPAFIAICGTCHSTNSGLDHTMSIPSNPRSITFGGGGHAFGPAPFYNGSSATTVSGRNSSLLKPKSCSNTDCHYRTSPIWSNF